MHLDDVLTELVEHCGDRLLRVAYQLTHDAAAAQDLVQEALLPRLPVGTPSRSRAGGLVRLPAPCGDQRVRPHSPARPSTHGCSGTPGPSGAYEIFFSYSEGPPVLVSILIGCHPAIDNDDLQATSASSVMPVVRQLLKPA